MNFTPSNFKTKFILLALALNLVACSANGNEATSNTTSTPTASSSSSVAITQPTRTNTDLTNDSSKYKFTQPLTLKNTPSSDIPFTENGDNFPQFRDFLIAQAKAQGFSNKVLQQLQSLSYNPRVVRADQSQYERIIANRKKNAEQQIEENPDQPVPAQPQESDLMSKYLSYHISTGKVDRAVSLMDNYSYALDKISAQYGVPKAVIIGLWGMESNFGSNQGKYDLLDSLASLAYEGRRRLFFTREFFNALRVMAINNFSKADMKSSWAGAIGQIQFMPTSYLVYGADGSDDGIVNIWYSTLDALASIANYLHKEGWNDKLPWGFAANVTLFQYRELSDYIGINKPARTLVEWQRLGITAKVDQGPILNGEAVNDQLKVRLIVPTNEPKMAYFVTNNYNVYMHWNRSTYFAFANGIFADRIYTQEILPTR